MVEEYIRTLEAVPRHCYRPGEHKQFQLRNRGLAYCHPDWRAARPFCVYIFLSCLIIEQMVLKGTGVLA
jgi:hypothetical protein